MRRSVFRESRVSNGYCQPAKLAIASGVARRRQLVRRSRRISWAWMHHAQVAWPSAPRATAQSTPSPSGR